MLAEFYGGPNDGLVLNMYGYAGKPIVKFPRTQYRWAELFKHDHSSHVHTALPDMRTYQYDLTYYIPQRDTAVYEYMGEI